MKFGRAFSENVIIEKERRGLFSTSHPSWWHGAGRALFFTSIVVIAAAILLWRLFFLTIIDGHMYRMLSDTNRTKQLIVHAPRGELLDRTGKPLAYNSQYFRLLRPCDEDPKTLCVAHISQEEGEVLKKKGLPEQWYLEEDYQRMYSASESLFHVIGYVGEVSDIQLQDDYYALRGYHMGDMVGKTGAEEVFEEELRGKDGKEFVEIDARGAVLRVLGRTPQIKGSSVMLSLDNGLSQVVADAFPKGEKGAVVVTKPMTGEILALYSSPTFSSQTLSLGMNQKEFEALVTHPDKPLFDRAIGGVYPPGSTFKIITAVAALEENSVKGNTVFEDTGEIKIGAFTFPNWYFKQYGKTEGAVDIVKALQRSNDIYFYKAGEAVGITKLGIWAKKLGVGTLLGIELPGEAEGLMPNPAWKNNTFSTLEDKAARNNEWYLGDTYHVAIGQGYLLTTPLQVNTWTNVIAHNGKLCKPTIKKLSAVSGQSPDCKDLGIRTETIDLVTEGMRRACETGGTGYPLFNFGIYKPVLSADRPVDDASTNQKTEATNSAKFIRIPVACKTGTAEFGSSDTSGQAKTHAWFTVFAPLPPDVGHKSAGQAPSSDGRTISGDPEISITVLIEGAGEGSDKAAPVAKKILEEWFSR